MRRAPTAVHLARGSMPHQTITTRERPECDNGTRLNLVALGAALGTKAPLVSAGTFYKQQRRSLGLSVRASEYTRGAIECRLLHWHAEIAQDSDMTAIYLMTRIHI